MKFLLVTLFASIQTTSASPPAIATTTAAGNTPGMCVQNLQHLPGCHRQDHTLVMVRGQLLPLQ